MNTAQSLSELKLTTLHSSCNFVPSFWKEQQTFCTPECTHKKLKKEPSQILGDRADY